MVTIAMEQGLAAVRARHPFAAVDWFRRELTANPENQEARGWLGQSLCVIGHILEGAEQLKTAGAALLSALPEEAGAVSRLLEVITSLQQWGEMEAALQLSRQLIAVAPRDPGAQRALAICCGQLNLHDEAVQAAEASLRLFPSPMMQVLTASLEADAGRQDDALDRLLQALATGAEPRAAFRGHKEAARVLDRLARFDEVFPHLEAAAALAPELPEFRAFHPDQARRMLAQNRQDYDAELLGRWAGRRFETRAPTFIMGFYRSGTTLAQSVLATHPDVFVADEAHLIGDVQRAMFRLQPGDRPAEALRALTPPMVEQLRRHYWERVALRYGAAAAEAPVFVDKFTMNTLDLGLINTIFPDANLVFMIRDPRDVVLSATLQLLPPTPATIHLLSWSSAANFYANVMDWWNVVRPMLTMTVLEVRYENVVRAFEPTVPRLFESLGLPWTGDASSFHKAAAGRYIASPSRGQVSRPLYDTSVQRWRNYEDRFSTVHEALDPFSRQFGYDT